MKPEDFIREKLRKEFGDGAVKVFDEALVKGLPCELCGKTKTTVSIRRFQREKGDVTQSLLYKAAGEAIPRGSTESSISIVPTLDPALCDECAGIAERSRAPFPGDPGYGR